MLTNEDVIEIINHNRDCIYALEQLIKEQIVEDEKLALIELIGRLYSEYTTGIYSSRYLEDIISKFSNSIQFVPSRESNRKKALIVMTTSASTGGHTAAVNNWARWDGAREYSLVLTEQSKRDVPGFLIETISESGGQVIEVDGRNYLDKAANLLEISQDYGFVLLFTHMYDVIPVIAYSHSNCAIPVLFYHHADFRFTFGLSVADEVLCMNEYDMERMVRVYGVEKEICTVIRVPGSSVIEQAQREPLKDEERHSARKKNNIPDETKVIISMGDDYKYESIQGYEFDKFVINLIHECEKETRFYIIGADKNSVKWQEMERLTDGRAKALGRLPIEMATEMISAADLFIASFPMRASGVSIALKCGVPVLLLYVTDRNKDLWGKIGADSVDELIERASSIINTGKDIIEIENRDGSPINKEEWLSEWNIIVDKKVEHHQHAIKPICEVDRQEIVNAQLLRANAGRIIADFLASDNDWDPEVLRVVFKIDDNIAIQYCSKLDDKVKLFKTQSVKHLKLFERSVSLLNAAQDGFNIGEFVREHGYSSIAIYGMHYLGVWMLDELRRNGLEVLYGIDRNADHINTDICLYNPNEIMPYADVLINTTAFSNAEIIEGITVPAFGEMISIDEILTIFSVSRNR